MEVLTGTKGLELTFWHNLYAKEVKSSDGLVPSESIGATQRDRLTINLGGLISCRGSAYVGRTFPEVEIAC